MGRGRTRQLLERESTVVRSGQALGASHRGRSDGDRRRQERGGGSGGGRRGRIIVCQVEASDLPLNLALRENQVSRPQRGGSPILAGERSEDDESAGGEPKRRILQEEMFQQLISS